METVSWSVMMLSMAGAGVASESFSPRTIGAVSGLLSSTTAFFWWWANWRGKLPDPNSQAVAAGADDELIAEPPLRVIGVSHEK